MHRRLKVGREDNARRELARATRAVPPRQAREVALSLPGTPTGSGPCYASDRLFGAPSGVQKNEHVFLGQ